MSAQHARKIGDLLSEFTGKSNIGGVANKHVVRIYFDEAPSEADAERIEKGTGYPTRVQGRSLVVEPHKPKRGW